MAYSPPPLRVRAAAPMGLLGLPPGITFGSEGLSRLTSSGGNHAGFRYLPLILRHLQVAEWTCRFESLLHPTHPSFASKPRTLRCYCLAKSWTCHRIQCSLIGCPPRTSLFTMPSPDSIARLSNHSTAPSGAAFRRTTTKIAIHAMATSKRQPPTNMATRPGFSLTISPGRVGKISEVISKLFHLSANHINH